MRECVVFLDPKGTIFEVVRVARERGYRVLALSSDLSLIKGAPEAYAAAAKMIDEIIPVSNWSDDSAILEILREINARSPIAGIYAGMDPCAFILAKLRMQYKLSTSSPEDISTILDKFKLRRKLNALGLSKIKNYHAKEIAIWDSWKPAGAVYFKPVHGFFSAYVQRCENESEFESAVEAWRKGNADEPGYLTNYLRSSPEFHLEDAFDGELLSVETIANRGEIQVLGLLSRILYSKNQIVEMGSCFPYPHPHAEKIIALVKDAHRALGLTDGPAHTEVIVSELGEVEIIDLNPRFVGADVLQSINYAYGIKIQDALFDFAIGGPTKLDLRLEQYSCIQYFLPPPIRILEKINFPKLPEIKFSTTFIKPGTSIAGSKRQIDYLGCYLTVMPSFKAAIERSRELRAKIKINGEYNGEY